MVGFDDLPLTTVRQPLHEMGRAATRALLSLIAGQPLATDDIRLPASLILRATTAPAHDPTRLSASGPVRDRLAGISWATFAVPGRLGGLGWTAP